MRSAILVGAAVWTGAVLAGSSSAARSDPYARYLAPPSVCPGSGQQGLSPRDEAKAVGCLVDHARLVQGLAPLRPSRELGRAAALKLADDVRCGRLVSHDPCGSGWCAVYHRAGYLPARRVRLGENLAYAQGSDATLRAVVDLWLNSPRHRRNLLDPRFRDGGFAALRAADGVLYASAFGTRAR